MKPKQLAVVLEQAILGREYVLITGAPGVGKTSILKQVRKSIQKTRKVDLTILYASVSDPTDFRGFYCIIDGKPEIVPFGELEKIYTSKELHIVFLDDLGQGAPAVQAAAMQFMDRVKDNPNVVIIGATNRREDRAGVTGLLEPVKSRFSTIVSLEVDVLQWIEWALDEGLPIPLIAFIKARPQLLHDFKASADLVNSPCPRTIASIGRLMKLDFPAEVRFEVFAGTAGEGFAAEFLAFLDIHSKLIDPSKVLLDPDGVDIPTDPSVLYAVCGALSRMATENNMDRVVKFANRLPGDFAVLLIRGCTKQNPKTMETGAFSEWTIRNPKVLL